MHLIQDDHNNQSHGSSCRSECGHHQEEHCHSGHHHGEYQGGHHHHHNAEHPDELMVNQEQALLAYMLDHNQHHALELEQMAKKLLAQGMDEAAAQIEIGVQEFQKGNMHLSVALALVKERQQEV